MFMDDFDTSSKAYRARQEASGDAARAAHARGRAFALTSNTATQVVPDDSRPALPATEPDPQKWGVWEMERSWPGTSTFKVVTSAGQLLMEVTVLEHMADRRFVHSLWRFLARYDPAGRLKLL